MTIPLTYKIDGPPGPQTDMIPGIGLVGKAPTILAKTARENVPAFPWKCVDASL
jgi:hypothetical protein